MPKIRDVHNLMAATAELPSQPNMEKKRHG